MSVLDSRRDENVVNSLVEPITKYASRRPQSAHLNTFGPPALLAMEYGECGPPYLSFWCLSHRSYQAVNLKPIKALPVILTAYPRIRIRIPARMQTPRTAPKMNNRQPLALKIAPVHPILFFIVVVRARRIDLRNLQLDTDQSNGCKTKQTSARVWMETLRTDSSRSMIPSSVSMGSRGSWSAMRELKLKA